MAARAIWKGDLKMGPAKVPVKLYSAAQDQTVRFHILDKKSKIRVKQHMVDESGKEVPNEEILKGFEVEPGTFVILDEKDLRVWSPKPRAKSKSHSSSRRKRFRLSITIVRTILDRMEISPPTSR